MDKSLLIKDLELILESAKRLDLRIFLDGGTLLGAIRNKDFIDGDTDFDFGILRKDLSDINRDNLIKELTSKNAQFKGFEAPSFAQRLEFGFRPYMLKFWSKYAHWNTDFWIFEERQNDYYHRGWGGYFYFLKETLDTLDPYMFHNCPVLVPHNPELYLEHLYGKTWKTPVHYSSKNKGPCYPNFNKELTKES